MGSPNLKQIESTIEEQYKPIRKYYSPIYGETTVIQDKKTHKSYAKVEKLLFPSKETTEYIEKRKKNIDEVLIKVENEFSFQVDLCSGNEMHVFILEYYERTLEEEMLSRRVSGDSFQFEELCEIFSSVIEGIQMQKQINLKTKQLYSNGSWLYAGNGKIKTLEPLFCAKNELKMSDSQCTSESGCESREYYQSPESFALFCRQEKFRAKQISYDESSMIFSLGMDFIECMLLADLSEVYNRSEKYVDFNKMNQIYEEIFEFYGEELQKLITKMTEPSPAKRPSLVDVDEYLKYIIQNYTNRLSGLTISKVSNQ